VRTPATMSGYYKEPEMSRAAFTEDGWLRTGDKGQFDGRGCLRITGRVKDLFKTSKGKYVAPAPIEDRLGAHPAVEACVVTGANMGQPVGVVMLSQNAIEHSANETDRAALVQTLSAHLAEVNSHLDPHEQLDCLVAVKTPWTVDNGFITPTFKVKRNRVDEVYGPQLESWVGKKKKVVFGD